jgi:hypothetical protein
MKILSKYFDKLRYVYTKRWGCSILASLLAVFLIALIVLFFTANSKGQESSESNHIKGKVFTGFVIVFSFFVAPIFLGRKSNERINPGKS